MKSIKTFNKAARILLAAILAAFVGNAFGSPMLGIAGLGLLQLAKSGMPRGVAFAAIFDGTGAELEDEDIDALDEAIYEGIFQNPQYTEFHDVVEKVVANKKIIVLNNLDGLAGSSQANCVPAANETTAGVTKKVWTPVMIEDRWIECYKDLMGTFFQKFLKPNANKADLTGTDYAKYLETLLAPYIKEIILRHAYFGDTALVAGTNNSLAGGQARYFKDVDGFWKQLDAIVAGNAAQGIAIARNAELTFVAQAFDVNDVDDQIVTEAFTAAYIALDTRMREKPKSDLVFICTQSLVDQYWQERRKASGIELAYTRTETGWDKLQFNGIDVIPFPFLDRMIRAYFIDGVGGTAWVNPHRGILCSRKTLKLGTEQGSSMETFLPFYSKEDKNYKVDWGCSLDAKIVLDNEVVLIQ